MVFGVAGLLGVPHVSLKQEPLLALALAVLLVVVLLAVALPPTLQHWLLEQLVAKLTHCGELGQHGPLGVPHAVMEAPPALASATFPLAPILVATAILVLATQLILALAQHIWPPMAFGLPGLVGILLAAPVLALALAQALLVVVFIALALVWIQASSAAQSLLHGLVGLLGRHGLEYAVVLRLALTLAHVHPPVGQALLTVAAALLPAPPSHCLKTAAKAHMAVNRTIHAKHALTVQLGSM